MRWSVVVVLVGLAGCTAPGLTQEEIFVSGEHAVPAPAPAPPMPWGPPDRLTPVIDLSSWTGHPSAPESRAIEYNGGFEEGADGEAAGWLVHGGARRDDSIARTGNASLHIPAGANVTQLVGGFAPEQPLQLRIHARLEPGATVRVEIVALTLGLTPIEGRRAERALPADAAASEEWTDLVTVPFVPLHAAQHLRIELAASGGSVHVDDVSLVLSPAEEPQTFVNGGFELGRSAWQFSGHAGIDCGFSFSPEGNCSLRLDHAQGGAAWQRFAPSGTALTLTFTYASQVSGWTDRMLVASLTFLDATGEPTREPHELSAHLLQAGWSPASTGEVDVPASTSAIVLRFETSPVEPAATWVDDVRISWTPAS